MSISQSDIDAMFGEGADSTPVMEEVAPPASTSPPPKQVEMTPAAGDDLSRVMGLAVVVSVVLADTEMSIESILGIKVGTIVEFAKPFDADLTLHVANCCIGAGQAVKVGENFGLRITRMEAVSALIEALGRGG